MRLNNKTTFLRVCEKYIPNRILCNEIVDVDKELLNNPIIGNDEEDMGEIMQYYLTDLTGDDINFITNHHTGFYFVYSERLYLWVMLVDHWGTNWEHITINTDLDYEYKKDIL